MSRGQTAKGTFGSIMSGGIENAFVQNLTFENKHWKTDPLNIAIR